VGGSVFQRLAERQLVAGASDTGRTLGPRDAGRHQDGRGPAWGPPMPGDRDGAAAHARAGGGMAIA
jgi:hypothetical protein